MDNFKKLTAATIGILILLALCIFLGLVFIRPNNVQAQSQPVSGIADKHGITVNGQGVVIVKPDQVKLNVGIYERGDTVQAVQQKVNTSQNAITKALTDLKVNQDDIQTTDYNISPVYRSDNNGNSTLQGYSVNTNLQVTVRNPADAGIIIDGATAAGANQVGNIQFTVANSTEAVKQARIAAIQDAKTKAEQFANASGIEIGTVLTINDEGGNLPATPTNFSPVAAASGSAASVPTNISTGQFRVQVNVQVTYSIK